MLQRVVTSFVSLAIFFAVVLSGQLVFNIAVCILAVGVLFELYRAMKAGKMLSCLGILSAVILALGYFMEHMQLAVIVSIMIFMISSVYLHGKKEFKLIYSVAFSTFYVILFFAAIIALRNKFGIFAVLPIFVAAWLTDVGAYFSGYFFGKHKLIPRVSPKKTIEGAVGGVILSILSCLLYGFIISVGFNVHILDYWQLAVLGAVASVLAQFGDLIASVIKRECNIKDFGTIFPGHGGILDRFDSVIFIAPVVYYFMIFICK